MSKKSTVATLLHDLIDNALRAQPVRAHIPHGQDEPTGFIKTPTVRGLTLDPEGDSLPSLIAPKNSRVVRTPLAILAGEEIRIDAALMRGSKVAAAGAAIIVAPSNMKPVATGTTGIVAFERRPGSFVVVDPAKFATVEQLVDGEDDECPEAEGLPILRREIDFDSSAVDQVRKAFRITLSRRDRKEVDSVEYSAQVMTSIVLGIARACDEALLQRIKDFTPLPFTLGAAAAQGVSFGDLRGLVGTGGAGATVSPNADLRLAGAPAELTDTMAESYIGAFGHAAVAVHPDITLLVDRTKKNGDVVLQLWVELCPLLPAPDRFWAVAA
jgi:hypothetical protein